MSRSLRALSGNSNASYAFWSNGESDGCVPTTGGSAWRGPIRFCTASLLTTYVDTGCSRDDGVDAASVVAAGSMAVGGMAVGGVEAGGIVASGVNAGGVEAGCGGAEGGVAAGGVDAGAVRV